MGVVDAISIVYVCVCVCVCVCVSTTRVVEVIVTGSLADKTTWLTETTTDLWLFPPHTHTQADHLAPWVILLFNKSEYKKTGSLFFYISPVCLLLVVGGGWTVERMTTYFLYSTHTDTDTHTHTINNSTTCTWATSITVTDNTTKMLK